MKPLSACLSILLICSVCFAQEYAYGEPIDLKGLKKVFIDTGADTKNRTKIIKGITKSGLGFEIVDGQKDAEIVLAYGAGSVSRKVVGSVMGGSVLLREKTQRTGEGVVVALNVRGKDRLIHSFEDVQNSRWERNPVDNYIREFLSVYKKGNK